jgi:hypothetical protein
MILRRYTTVLLIAVSCLAQSPPADSPTKNASTIATWKTNGKWNGRFWRSFDMEGKRAFLFGFGEATDLIVMLTSKGFEDYKKSLLLFWPPLTFDEILTSLDRFYDVPENRPITIIDGLNVVSQRATGSSEEDIQAYIAKRRAAASK